MLEICSLPQIDTLVGGELLYLNFKSKEAENLVNINEEAAVFGLTFFVDGATVKIMPLINATALSENISPVVLEIYDCLYHMVAGGNKDAPYIADIILHNLIVIDKKMYSNDLIFFDGASNVHNAGKIIESKFTRVTCIHGAEHFVDLLLTDISKIEEIKASLLLAVRVRIFHVFCLTVSI